MTCLFKQVISEVVTNVPAVEVWFCSVWFLCLFLFLIVKSNFAEHKWDSPMSSVRLITKKRLQVPTKNFAAT